MSNRTFIYIYDSFGDVQPYISKKSRVNIVEIKWLSFNTHVNTMEA
jgi:hypothetical protein